MTVKELSEKLGLEIVTEGDINREITGGYCGDLLSWVMGRAQGGDVWVTIMSNVNTIAVASLTDVACVILAEGVHLDEAAAQKAVDNEINVLRTETSAFSLCATIKEYV